VRQNYCAHGVWLKLSEILSCVAGHLNSGGLHAATIGMPVIGRHDNGCAHAARRLINRHFRIFIS